MSKHTLWSVLREAIFGCPVRKQYERVEDALKLKAKYVGEAELDRTMANFYTERVMAIDPHQDWWAFADAKQKQHDYQHSCVRNEARVREADATLNRYMKVLNNDPAPSAAAYAASPDPYHIDGAVNTAASPAWPFICTCTFDRNPCPSCATAAPAWPFICTCTLGHAPCPSCQRLQESPGATPVDESDTADEGKRPDAAELPPRG